jgi:NAD(P)-dependent dehydrogenase (short-subunit alcohol dehydrogenase family)
VLGASRGLGRAIAESLAQAGFDVALGARTLSQGDKHDYWVNLDSATIPGSLEETAMLVKGHGSKAYCVQMDLLDLEGCVSALDKVYSMTGRLDVVVNSAVYQGKGCLSRFLDLDTNDYGKMLLCNVQTPVAVMKRALQLMLSSERGGTLIQLSSSSVNLKPRFPVDGGGWDFGYASSKSAVSKLMGLLAVEHPYEASKVRFFNVEPGLVVTELMKASKLADGYSQGFGWVPPQVTGQVVRYLACAPASSISDLLGKSIYAPKLCESLDLIPGYKENKPLSSNSIL